jgi:hypothetical protein
MRSLTFLLIAAAVLVGCSSDDSLPLTETIAIDGTDYVIDYPEGWFTEERESFLGIGENAADIGPTPDRILGGPIVTIEHQAPSALGLDDDAGVDGFVELNSRIFRWPDDSATSTVEIAGSPATVVRFAAPSELERNVAFAMGSIGDRFMLATLQVGNDRDIEDYLPTFESMLESLRPTS